MSLSPSPPTTDNARRPAGPPLQPACQWRAGNADHHTISEASHPDCRKVISLQSSLMPAVGTFHIWIMAPRRLRLKQITSGHAHDREPAYPPDGTTIRVCIRLRLQGSYDFGTVDIATGRLKRSLRRKADEGFFAVPPGLPMARRSRPVVSGTGFTGKTLSRSKLATGHRDRLWFPALLKAASKAPAIP